MMLLLSALSLGANAASGAPENRLKASYTYGFDLQSLLDLLCEKWGICLPGTAEKPVGKENAQPAESADSKEDKAEEALENSVSAYEKEVVRLVNAERAKYGLSALKLSEKLSDGARMKSEDMRKNKYFSHTSPTYGSPFDQMKALGITYRSAGENIAMGYKTPAAVVDAWMRSEGHRANILSAKYTEIGVGYVEDGHYWTQWFRG